MDRRTVLALPASALLPSARGEGQPDLGALAGLLARQVPASHPRVLVRRNELSDLREFVGALATQSAPVPALRALQEYRAPAAPPGPPAQPRGVGQARTLAEQQAWRAAGAAAITTQWLAFRHLALGQPGDGEQARRWLLHLCAWPLRTPAQFQASSDAFVQTFQAIALAYDWLHDVLGEQDRAAVRQEMAQRLDSLYEGVRARIELARQQVPAEGLSWPMRYVATLGHAALSLHGEHPRAEEQLAWVNAWYAQRFPIWGGDDGGWSEGIQYLVSALSHHLRLLEDLALLGVSQALGRPFWRNTGYFLAHFQLPYETASFADLPTPPRPTPERRLLMEKLALIHRDGMLLSLADRYGTRLPAGGNYYQYGAMDTLLHLWRRQRATEPARLPLASLPPSRHFADVGWVSMQSHWDLAGDTLMLGFKSSPTGSVSHAFADQNAFVINAHGRAMALSTGVRDLYGSEHYERWTRDARSKNMILVNGQGPSGRDPDGTARILRFASTGRCDLASGDASRAYRRQARRALRHVLFADRRYFVMLDEIETDRPAQHQWLLHTPVQPRLDGNEAGIHADLGPCGLRVDIVLPAASDLGFSQHDRLEPPPIPGMADPPPTWHNVVETLSSGRSRRFLVVMRPWKDQAPVEPTRHRPTRSGHAADIGADTVLIAEETDPEVRTSDGRFALDGRAAWLGRDALTLLHASALRTPQFTLESDAPLSADVHLRAQGWSIVLEPGDSLTLRVRAPADARAIALPEGGRWQRDGDHLVVVLPVRWQRAKIVAAWP